MPIASPAQMEAALQPLHEAKKAAHGVRIDCSVGWYAGAGDISSDLLIAELWSFVVFAKRRMAIIALWWWSKAIAAAGAWSQRQSILVCWPRWSGQAFDSPLQPVRHRLLKAVRIRWQQADSLELILKINSYSYKVWRLIESDYSLRGALAISFGDLGAASDPAWYRS